MKRFSILILLMACTLCLWAQNPVANAKAVVTVGNARFTVLTDRLVRLEWAEDGVWEDNATLAIINRELPVPSFTTSRQGKAVTIKTKALTLHYTGEGKLSADNLSVTFTMAGKSVRWTPGMEDKGNLMGTTRTLDGCMGADKISNNDPMETGVLSRDGWAVVDESQRHLMVKSESDWGEWVASRKEGDRQDLYLFAYGHDYKAALADFTRIAGRIPMPPKYVFGYWWSRYWAYSQDEFIELANEFRSRQLPIDVMVIDMDWHNTWPATGRRQRRDQWGQNIGWTGYTWNRDLFPDPVSFLNELHSMNLKTSLNLHPASGITEQEDCYPAFVADYLSRTSDYDGPKDYIYQGGENITPPARPRRPNSNRPQEEQKPVFAKAGYHAPVPFRIDQQEWADAYFHSVLHPLEEQGIDFWWLDWQQWKESKYTAGLSNTFWLNHTFFNDKVRQSQHKSLSEAQRPLIYHRWGGLGSHRYQLGFSGDTHISWDVLAYLPYFTSTASNVGYGYWGHDLGGHMQREQKPTNPELYTRWLQYGVFSPLFKTHCTNSDIIERRFWTFEDHYQYMRDALELRYALSPYIYDAARQAYDTGISLCRPMYYDYPEDNRAYVMKEQYMFGDHILAATLCQPMDSLTGKTARQVWLPAGSDWYDMAHHQLMKGGVVKTLYYTIAENAWFVRAGAIIPMAAKGIQNLQEHNNALRLYIAPGTGKSECVHYEDDEVSQAYQNEYATTRIVKSSTSASCTVTIDPIRGNYQGMAAEREWTIVLGGVQRQPKANCDGKTLQVTYDKDTREATIMVGTRSVNASTKIAIQY